MSGHEDREGEEVDGDFRGIAQPHDRFFKYWMAKPENASGFFRAVVPDELHPWVSDPARLTLQNVSFVSEELREKQSDLLWKCETEGRESAFIYVLFEHQRNPDPSMAARMFFYLARIWERHLSGKGLDGKQKLPFVFPLVLYQGSREWTGTTQFSDLVDLPGESLSPHVPEFSFELLSLKELNLDHLTPLALKVGLEAMSVAISGDFVRWLHRLRSTFQEGESTFSEVDVVIRYIFEIAPEDQKRAMIESVQSENDEVSAATRTVADALIFEGLVKGREEGKEEGRLRERRTITRNMAKKGFDPEQIADVMGLSVEEVTAILAD